MLESRVGVGAPALTARLLALPILALVLGACASEALPSEPPPLADLEEPLALRREPDDEAQRAALAPGGFTGLIVGEAPRALDQSGFGAPLGVPVVEVIQNSPAQAAGVRRGDLLVAVGRGADEQVLEWASEWRELERAAAPGDQLALLLDRAGREVELEVEVEARLSSAPRLSLQRYRETDHVGVVLRAATEVEARAAGLGAGAGAVVVGLAGDSPWRAGAEGALFGDLIVRVDGKSVAHAEVVLGAIRSGELGQVLEVDVVREGRELRLRLPVSRRVRETSSVKIPLLFSYDKQTDSSRTSALLGLFRFRRTRAAWDVRLLWFLSFGGGDADRLEELSK